MESTLSVRRRVACAAAVGLAVMLASASSTFAATIHVPSDSTTITAAISGAADYDTVLVAPGTYGGPGNENIHFQGKKLIVRSETGATGTVLLTGDTVRTFVFDQGEDSLAILDGFTISGGYDSTLTWNAPYRGGILIDSAAPVIRNCVISGCFAANGGGLDITSKGRPQLMGCTIQRNFAASLGGGVRSFGNGVLFEDCRIVENRAASWAGGGLLVTWNVTLKHCYIGQNKVGAATLVPDCYGGGVCALASTELTIDSCILSQNSAVLGGAIAVSEGSLNISNSIVYNNVARGEYAGILVDVYGAADLEGLSISHCTFACNYASNDAADGVAVRGFATAHADYQPEVSIGNHPDRVAALAGSFDISNSVFAFLSSAAIGQFGESVPVSCTYNDVWSIVNGPRYAGNLADQTGTNGNIAADPLFCEVSDTTLTLDQSSPCAGTGMSGADMGAMPVTCNNYAVRMPTRIDVPALADYDTTRASVTAAISGALPWDTIFFSSAAYSWLANIVTSKPLYFLGNGRGSTVLGVWDPYDPSFPVGFELRSFCVIQSLTVEAVSLQPDGSLSGIGIICDSVSPIVHDCDVRAGGWGMMPLGKALVVRKSSPYMNQSEVYRDLGPFVELTGEMDMVAPDNFWGWLTDSLEIAYFMFDSHLSQDDFFGLVYFSPFLLNPPTPVRDDNRPELPASAALSQNYPNPFNPSTTIAFDLPHREHTRLVIIDILGREVRTLIDRELAAANYRVDWDGKDNRGRAVGTGVYLYRLTAGTFTESRKMMLVK